jgi:hypothetical protein
LSYESKINISYFIKEVQDARIEIQLVFDKPLYVSQGSQEDRAIVYIPILVEEADERLLSEYLTFKVEVPVPQQVRSEEELQTLTETAQTTGNSAMSLFWIYLALAILLKGVMGMMWGLFQAL